MNRRSRTLWIAPTMLLAAACTQADEQSSMEMSAGHVAAINEVREGEASMLNTSMIENISHVYAADVVMLPPDGPAVMGREAAAVWFEEFVGMMEVHMEYTSSEVTVAGEWAIERYTGSATMTPREGGETTTESIKGIHIYRLHPDGSWLIVQDIWNYDEPTMEGH